MPSVMGQCPALRPHCPVSPAVVSLWAVHTLTLASASWRILVIHDLPIGTPFPCLSDKSASGDGGGQATVGQCY